MVFIGYQCHIGFCLDYVVAYTGDESTLFYILMLDLRKHLWRYFVILLKYFVFHFWGCWGWGLGGGGLIVCVGGGGG